MCEEYRFGTVASLPGHLCHTLVLKVSKQQFLWRSKYVNRTYFGLFGAPGVLTPCPPW